jgi:hypothetical protein
MTDIDRLRYLVSHSSSLQGLTRVPFGVYLMTAGVLRAVWPPARPYVAPTSVGQLCAYFLILALWSGIRREYRRSYGRVTGAVAPGSDWLFAVLWAGAFLAATSYDFGHRGTSAFYTQQIVWAVPFLWVGVSDRRRRYYVFAGLLVALMSLSPAVTSDGYSQWAATEFSFGAAIALTGIADHLVWVRGLHALQGGSHGEPI